MKKHGFEEMNLKAVLFDMDGVLFDSMPNHALAWSEGMKKYGLPMTKEEAYMHESRTGAGTINILAQRTWGRDATEEEKQLLGMTPEFLAEDRRRYEELTPEQQSERPLPGHICRAKGCVQCNNTGYRGRIGVYEMMQVTPKLRRIIAAKGTTEEIEKVAIEEGMSKLRNSAARLTMRGITTIDEMKRIVYAEE